MNRMLWACWFGGEDYQRLAHVLEYSARKHCPGWSVDVVHLAGEQEASAAANTRKLDLWAEVIGNEEDGTEAVLIDADCAVLAPLDSIWDEPFDVALTLRNRRRHPFPFNAGVVFVRVNDRSKAFMAEWARINRELLVDRSELSRWKRRFGGMNQAALGKLMSLGGAGAKAVAVPCALWNCEDSTWREFGPQTKIIHAKSALRRTVLGYKGIPYLRGLTRLWRSLEREAR